MSLIENPTPCDARSTFSDADARDYLAQHPMERSARKLGPLFGWHRSRVQRLLNRLGGETTETLTETLGATPREMPTPHQRRAMLIAGVEDFDRKFPQETAAEIVDRAIAEGKVPLQPEAEDEGQEFDWAHDDAVVLQDQPGTAVYLNPAGELVIRQRHPYGKDDVCVYVSAPYVARFIDRLCDVAGVPSFP